MGLMILGPTLLLVCLVIAVAVAALSYGDRPFGLMTRSTFGAGWALLRAMVGWLMNNYLYGRLLPGST